MLYELAITPDVFDTALADDKPELGTELKELLKDLRLNGMIANLDKDKWRQVIGERIRSDPSNREDIRALKLRTDLLKYLNILYDYHRLPKHPARKNGRPIGDMDWLGLALESHERIPFDWIVVGDGTVNRGKISSDTIFELTNLEDLRSSQSWEDRPHSRSVRMCESEYKQVLGPLLRHAKVLHIVDPYLTCRGNHLPRIVELCALAMGNRGQGRVEGNIHLHVCIDNNRTSMTPDQTIDEWAQHLEPFRKQSGSLHDFRVVVWKRKPFIKGRRVHDRYLLTDQCGVGVQGGFDSWDEDTEEETDWGILGIPLWNKRRGEYEQTETGPHEFLKEQSLPYRELYAKPASRS